MCFHSFDAYDGMLGVFRMNELPRVVQRKRDPRHGIPLDHYEILADRSVLARSLRVGILYLRFISDQF